MKKPVADLASYLKQIDKHVAYLERNIPKLSKEELKEILPDLKKLQKAFQKYKKGTK